MIAATSPASHPDFVDLSSDTGDTGANPIGSRWQRALAEAITDPAELLNILQLDSALLPAARRAAALFPLRVPRGFVNRMRIGDNDDPLLKQVLPLGAELAVTPGFFSDPVGDMASRAAPGVLHKYSGRALLITTGACGVHCRYCFRRHFPYGEESTTQSHWQQALDYLRQDSSITEVLLSGGDPLSLSDRRLAQLSAGIESIPHIRRLRIHTRQPIVLPERIDQGFCQWLANVKLQKVVVLHTNHSNEIDASVRVACAQLTDCGATLLNQSVLLAGVNDNVEALAGLSESLFAAGVLPYYLHLLDRVQGAAHFDVGAEQGATLITGLAARLPGYLVPKLVREIAGERSKTAIATAPSLFP
jgi:EF-P beta-lysylation protein EpmB